LTAGSASAPVTLTFMDPAGPNDSYASDIQCGNGTTIARTGIGSPSSATCTYTRAGVYTVSATVSDEDGGTSASAFYRSVIVFDPEGGSVTAGAFYDIPGQGDRKAHFTFSAGFVSGQTTVPNGMVSFWIPDREIDFQSTDLEMLVVSEDRALFWGTGTLNGAAARFRITAVDGQRAGRDGGADAVRLEFWDRSGALVYDSQPGAALDAPVTQRIEGGDIRIYRE
jgi:hypothetical protein